MLEDRFVPSDKSLGYSQPPLRGENDCRGRSLMTSIYRDLYGPKTLVTRWLSDVSSTITTR